MKPEEIKKNLNRRVRLRSSKLRLEADFILTGAIFRRGENGYYYQAELQDLNQERSVLICSLDEIEPEKKV